MTTSCPPVAWHRGPMIAFDLETTGIDIETVRIVTSALVLIDPGQPTHTTNRLINPGVDIPDAAAAIHGITTEHAFQHGEAPYDVLEDTTSRLAHAIQGGIPIVGMNHGSYDLNLLDRECRRHGITPLSDRVERLAPVIDVLVLDKAMDRYRKGSRKLTALCEHYGVQLDNAHNSAADALASCRLAYKIASRYPALQIPLDDLHNQQIGWATGQRASFAAHRQRTGQPLEPSEIDGTWPIRPARVTAAV